MITLLIIGFCVLLFAVVQIIRALLKLVKAAFYLFFANEKQIDEAFKKHVVKESDAYKSFENNMEKKLRQGI